MSISLVSAPVLGFDLVRHPAGARIAAILLRALTFGPAEVEQLGRAAAATMRDDVRRQAWQHLHDEEMVRGPGALAGSSLAPSASSAAPGIDGLADTLRRSLIVDLDDLEHLIRKDIFSWADSGPELELQALLVAPEFLRAAGDAVLDAVAALWVDESPDWLYATLANPFTAAVAGIGLLGTDIGPCGPAVSEVLTALAAFDDNDRARMRAVVSLLGAGTQDWAQAVHKATWAAYTTGRIRAAASAQLLAVQAFADAGFDAADGAEGVWNAVSGHIQATVVADVLDADIRSTLARTWESVAP